MTEHSRPNLKAKFESGDKPDGGDFVDIIDSFLNVQDGDVQVFSGPVAAPLLSTVNVSSDDIYVDNVIFGDATIQEFSLDSVSADGINTSSLAALSTITAPIVSAQVVNAISLRHNNPHALVYAADTNFITTPSSGYTIISALLSGAPNGVLGFSHNGSTIVTYTGSTTAAMHVKYSVCLSYATSNSIAPVSLFRNGTIVPESRCSITLNSAQAIAQPFIGDAIIKMSPSDAVDLRVQVTSTGVIDMTMLSYNISIAPVSYDS